MKKTILTTVFILASLSGFGQVYNPGGTVTDSISAFTGNTIDFHNVVDMKNHKITGLSTPDNDDEAVNLKYFNGRVIDQLETIAELEAYEGASTTIIVKDSLRGGVFNKISVASLTADNGTVFNSADGGFWFRQYNKEAGQNVLWYGADPTGVQDCSLILEQLIAHESFRTGKIYFPPGTYSIENMIGDVEETNPENYRITNNIEIIGSPETKIMVNSPVEIGAVFGFETGLDPVNITFKNIEIDGNNLANRGIYIRHIRDLDETKLGNNVSITGMEIRNINLGANQVVSSAAGIYLYGKNESIIIENNIIENITTENASAAQGIQVNGASDFKRLPKYTSIRNNIIRNVIRTDTLVGTDQDGIAVLYQASYIDTYKPMNLIVEGNRIINCRGRFIKIQQQNAHVSDNFMMLEPDFEMDEELNLQGVLIGYSDAIVEGNSFLYLNDVGRPHGMAISITERQLDSTMHRTIVKKNKVVLNDSIPYFFGAIEGAGGYFNGNVSVENNSIEGAVGSFIWLSGQTAIQTQRKFIVDGNSIDSVMHYLVDNENNFGLSVDELVIQAQNNTIRNSTVPISQTYEDAILINNSGLSEADTYLRKTAIDTLIGESGNQSITRTLAGWRNNTPNDPNNFNEGKILAFESGNSGMFVFGDGDTNSRRFGIQVSHESSNFSNANGTLELMPFGGSVKIRGEEAATQQDISDSLSANVQEFWNNAPLLHEQTITSSELLNISTTPVELIPAPGAGKIIVVEKVVGFIEFETVEYDFSQGLNIGTNATQVTIFPSFLNEDADSYFSLPQIEQGSYITVNDNLTLRNSAVTVTQGDGILHLKIYYRIVEF